MGSHRKSKKRKRAEESDEESGVFAVGRCHRFSGSHWVLYLLECLELVLKARVAEGALDKKLDQQWVRFNAISLFA